MGSMIVSGLEHDTAHDAKARFERWNDAVCTRWNMHVIDSSLIDPTALCLFSSVKVSFASTRRAQD